MRKRQVLVRKKMIRKYQDLLGSTDLLQDTKPGRTREPSLDTARTKGVLLLQRRNNV